MIVEECLCAFREEKNFSTKPGVLFSAKWKSTAVVFFLTIGLSLLVCSPLFSQGSAGRIVGTVVDSNGGVVAGATVTILDVERGTTRILTTEDVGAYNAPNLLPGTYKVRVELKGFKTFERQNLTLEVGQELRVDVTLQPGEQTQTITVEETAPLVETTNATIGGALQNEEINNLPLNGRNFQNLLALRPGVTIYPGGSAWTKSTNGLRPHDNMFTVNGINSNDPWMAQSVMNANMAAGDAGTILPIDAIDEFRTEQNPGAEYGWKPGSVVNVGIKSGTNSLHGTAYAYGRDGAWDARNFFNPQPNPVAPLDVEQFGASVGGPIKKDKIFFFANYEEQMYNVGSPAQHTVPVTDGAGANDPNFGLIGACQAALGAGKLTALSAQLAGLDTSCNKQSWYPGFFLPATGPAGERANVNSNIGTTNKIYAGISRVDYHVNNKNSVYASYFISQGSGVAVDNPPAEINTAWLTDTFARSQVFSAGWVFTPSSSWTIESRVGYSYYHQIFLSNDSTQNPATYTLDGHTYTINTGQTDPAYFGFPQTQWQGGYNMQFGLNWPKYVGPDGVLNIVEHLSYLHGNHTFIFGGEILNLQSSNNVTQYTKGYLRFGDTSGATGLPALQNFFEGISNRARFSSGDFQRQISSNGFAFFIQDNWRIKPRMMLNLGVRYELNTVMKERDGLMGNFDPNAGLLQVGNGIPSPYDGDHNNFAPRLGLAWDIRGDGKTVLRAGGSVEYEQFSFDTFNALGNLVGLRTIPTGATLAYTTTDPVTGLPVQVVKPGSGNISSAATFFAGAGLAGVNNNWANNSTTPLFSGASPACGDGTITLTNGNTPQPCNILGVDRHLRSPYVTTWMVDLQRQITNSLSLDIGYVGNHGTKYLGLTDLNQPPVGVAWGSPTVAGTPAFNCVQSASTGYNNCLSKGNLNTLAANELLAQPFHSKFPYLGYINWLSNLGNSNYNALQVTLTQRTSHGLSFVTGYTYSHALDMTSDNWGAGLVSPIDSANPHSLYGNSLFDMAHRFTFSATYNIPGIKSPGQILQGWSVNSIVTVETGMPWGVNDLTTDFSGTNEIGGSAPEGEKWNFYGNRADFTSKNSMLTSNGGQGGIPYFKGTSNSACLTQATANGQLAVASLTNLGCYAVGSSFLIPPAFGTTGTSGRDSYRGVPFSNVDFSVTKMMKFKERLTAQFRAEFFNVLNHPNFANAFGGPGGDNSYTDPSALAGASFGFRPDTPDVLSSNPVLGSGGARAIQLGLKLLF